jgi:hypothetical protein
MKNLDRGALIKHVQEKHPKDRAVYFISLLIYSLDVPSVYASHGEIQTIELVIFLASSNVRFVRPHGPET